MPRPLHVNECSSLGRGQTDTVDAGRVPPPAQRPTNVFATQAHALTAGDDLMLALAVEATIPHLDLVESLAPAPKPSAEGLAKVQQGA